jgi:hypothetical protein
MINECAFWVVVFFSYYFLLHIWGWALAFLFVCPFNCLSFGTCNWKTTASVSSIQHTLFHPPFFVFRCVFSVMGRFDFVDC